MEIPALPRNVTITRVYADLMKYLFQGARSFFQDATPGGARIWKRLEDQIVIVLCTPNAWDMSQQNFLRNAAVKAGLVKKSDAESLVEFVTEGEASVHYALKYTNGDIWLKRAPCLWWQMPGAPQSTVPSMSANQLSRVWSWRKCVEVNASRYALSTGEPLHRP
jgi:hypothetical protein